MPVLSSADLATLAPLDLLNAVAEGNVGFDHAFLNAFLRDREAALDALDAFVAADHEDDRVDIEDQVFELYRHLRDPRALPFYMLLLRTQMDGVQDELIEAFAEMGEPAVQPLLDLYNEVEEEEGGEIAFVLAALQLDDSRITELLLSRLEYDAQDAAICLGLHGDPAARPALEALLSEVADRPEADLLKSDAEEAIERLSGERERAERAPYNIYDHYVEFTPPFFEVMEPSETLEWLASPDSRVRLAVAESLEDVDLTENIAASIPDKATAEEDLAVRCALWKCLLQTELADDIAARVQARYDDEATDPLERATLAIVLAKARYNDALKGQILDLYKSAELRPLAIEAMWYTNDTEFLPLIEGHLEDEDLDTRRAAILGIGFFVDTSAASMLIPAMKIEQLRTDAIYSYSLAHPGEVSRVTAQKVLKHVDQIAGGLSHEEAELAMNAIDLRLSISGGRPYFAQEE